MSEPNKPVTATEIRERRRAAWALGPLELWVFAHNQAAKQAGFRDGQHREQPNLIAWWPERGDDNLRGLELGRVIVTDMARRWAYGDRAREEMLHRGLHFARERLRREPMLWIDL